MRLRDVGEFELIERMARVFGTNRAAAPDEAAAFSRLTTGIGDDAAVWNSGGGVYSIATTDAMIEGSHFTRSTTGWYELGWKAMVSNLSDIAGMGAVPRYALATLGAGPDQELDDILEICRGMAEAAGRFGAAIVGGDTVTSPIIVLSITLIGEVVASGAEGVAPPLLSRFNARPGDLVAVTGQLGSSGGGLELLMNQPGFDAARLSPLVRAHQLPVPRVKEGRLLVDAGVRCGMDLSDGLSGDLVRICRACTVSAVVDVDRLPVDPLLSETFGDRAIELALSGGEDYELLCTAPPVEMDKARVLLEAEGTSLTVVGRIVPANGQTPGVSLVRSDGSSYSPARLGWEHFTEHAR